MGGQRDRVPPASGSTDPGRKITDRVTAAYAAVALLALLALALIIVLSSDSDPASGGNAHINLASGITHGVAPDGRAGIELPDSEVPGLRTAARAAGCELRLRLRDEGHDHLRRDSPEPDYATSPPTSGAHVEEQLADGAYRETPPQVSVVHSLEHGRLAIQYRPDLPERAQLELVGLYDTMYGGSLLFPLPEMPFAVAATTWTNLLGCRAYREASTLTAIRAFAVATWGRFGGEPLLGLQPESPTPNPSLTPP